MSFTIVLFACLFCVVLGQKGPCEIADGGHGSYGQCKSIFNCQSLLSLANKANKTIEEKTLLQRSHCGIDDYAPAVCCPTQNEQSLCYTPEGKPGQCISVYSCPELVKLLTPKPPLAEVLRFVQNSKCGINQYSVCCGPIPNFDSKSEGQCDLTSVPPDPRIKCCGVDITSQKKNFGNETLIDQYPWLAMIEYDQNGTMLLRGNGALISGKYVLTSAVSVDVKLLGRPVNIRLGEYDTSHEGPDCMAVEGGGEDCTDGAISIPIESIIKHPMFNSRQKINDIALVRMTRSAPYTDFIRPICLPTVDVTQILGHLYFTAAGWGGSESIRRNKIKMQVTLPYVDLSVCQLEYSRPGRSVTLGAGHLCAGGVKGMDTCQGDSTLMYGNVDRFEYIGIVSFGVLPCGRLNTPTVYTNVYSYVSWIRDTIVP